MPETDENEVTQLLETLDEYVGKKTVSAADTEEQVEKALNGSIGCCLSWLCITVGVAAIWITWGKSAGIWAALAIAVFLWIMHHIATRSSRKKS